MYKLSIIIPVYNQEKLIKACLNSIIKQLNNDIQIIVVDDGSTDNSKKIIEQYVNKKPELIKYYKKNNTGVADTRNYGISKANGKYILFVDSDDYIEKDFISTMLKYIEEDVDIIKFKMKKINSKKELLEQIDGPVFTKKTGEEAFNELVFSDILIDSPCVYLFKKELFTKNNLKFKKHTQHEDFGLIPLLIVKAKSVISINYYGYCYLQTSNSIIRNEDYKKTIKKFNDCLIHYDNMIDFVLREDINKKTVRNIKAYYTNTIILKLNELRKQDKDIYIHEIKKRNMLSNVKVTNFRQLIKKIILKLDVKLYLKLK